MRYTAVGKRVPRIDGVDKVTGRTRFGADMTLPGMICGAVLRSPHPHAELRRVDTKKAEKMPGVYAVLTGKDFPRDDLGGVPVLARDRVRHQGEAVAAVAAETLEQANAALARIEVEYRPLPLVSDVRQAIAPGAPVIHEHSEDPERPNVCAVVESKRGEGVAAFAQADHVFEDTFETPWLHQGFLETHYAIARAEPGSGRLTVWTSTQGQFEQRADLAHILGLSMSHVRVIGLPVGGAFGAKNALCVEHICAELARRAGRPVKLMVNRQDDFFATRLCGGSVLEFNRERLAVCGGRVHTWTDVEDARVLFCPRLIGLRRCVCQRLPGVLPTGAAVAIAAVERINVPIGPGGIHRNDGRQSCGQK